MSNKLTKKKIDLLIVEVLEEKFSFGNDYKLTGDGSNKYKSLFDSLINQLKKLAGDNNKLEDADFEFLSSGNPIKYVELSNNKRAAIDNLIIQLLNSSLDINPATKEMVKKAREVYTEIFSYLSKNPDKINSELESRLITFRKQLKGNDPIRTAAATAIKSFYKKLSDTTGKPQSVSQPAIRPAQGQSGQYSSEVGPILAKVFTNGEDTIEKRVSTLSQISEEYYKASTGDVDAIKTIEEKDVRTVLAEVLLLDYFVEIAKSFDFGSGGYVFEYFLALLTGGKVLGKETGPSGQMGAVDFETKDGGKGSAKWYSKASALKQAVSGFKVDEPVQYVVGVKKQSMESKGKKTVGGTADPSKLIIVDIYNFTVTATQIDYKTESGEPASGTFKFSTQNQEVQATGNLNLGTGVKSTSTHLYIAQVRTKTFREMISSSLNNLIDQTAKDAVELLSVYLDNLRVAESSGKKYSVSGDIADGENTLQAIDVADDNLAALIQTLDKKGVTGQKGTRKIQENKIKSLKDLDKLIEHVILSNMLLK